MVEVLFYDKDFKIVESIKFYVSDANKAGESLIEHLFREVINVNKFYELVAKKSVMCRMQLWISKDDFIHIGDGTLETDGKGEPLGYYF